MNEEIVSGLNNAVAHGVSLEGAAQSFINAGYNAAEVREAQTFLGRGFAPLPKTPVVETKPAVSASPVSSAPSTPQILQAAQPGMAKPETKQASKKTIILLVVLAILVLIAGIASVLMLYLR